MFQEVPLNNEFVIFFIIILTNDFRDDEFRNKLTGLLRKSERTYLEGQLDLYHNDMGKAWKVLRSVLNQNTYNRNPSTFKIDNETVTDPCIISNEFNKYFVEIGPKLAERLVPN